MPRHRYTLAQVYDDQPYAPHVYLEKYRAYLILTQRRLEYVLMHLKRTHVFARQWNLLAKQNFRRIHAPATQQKILVKHMVALFGNTPHKVKQAHIYDSK
jgi:hypothetical protein